MGESTENGTYFDDLNLEVGAKLQLVTIHDSKKIMSFTSLIGYEQNGYLFVKIPQVNGKDVPLQIGERVDIRAFSGVSIYDFPCTIEAVYQTRHKFMELSFPREIKQIPLRRDLRAPVELPIKVTSESGNSIDAVVQDLSASGAQIECDQPMGEIGQYLDITLRIENKTTEQEFIVSNKATIRNQKQDKDRNSKKPAKFRYGIQFNNLSESDAVMLQNYVYELILLKRK